VKTASILATVWLITVWPVVLCLLGGCVEPEVPTFPSCPEDAFEWNDAAAWNKALLAARALEELEGVEPPLMVVREREEWPFPGARGMFTPTLCGEGHYVAWFLDPVDYNLTPPHEALHAVLFLLGKDDPGHTDPAWERLK
jgi:hypothetical protein